MSKQVQKPIPPEEFGRAALQGDSLLTAGVDKFCALPMKRQWRGMI